MTKLGILFTNRYFISFWRWSTSQTTHFIVVWSHCWWRIKGNQAHFSAPTKATSISFKLGLFPFKRVLARKLVLKTRLIQFSSLFSVFRKCILCFVCYSGARTYVVVNWNCKLKYLQNAERNYHSTDWTMWKPKWEVFKDVFNDFYV